MAGLGLTSMQVCGMQEIALTELEMLQAKYRSGGNSELCRNQSYNEDAYD
jgi:hypothetical protein